MKIDTVISGYFKLDGGAMFGIVPKRMWEKIYPADEQNLCTWAMRSLLIENQDKKIIIDCGIGMKQDEKFRSHFYPHGDDVCTGLARKRTMPEEITDVFLTHLHFDHVGGAFYREGDQILPTFPNARYWSSEEHFQWAIEPNLREKASFLPENILPLNVKGRTTFIETERDDFKIFDFFSIRFLNGHTKAMMMPIIHRPNLPDLVFCADLIPSSAHLGLPYGLSYDIDPLITIDEKERLLEEAITANFDLVLEHDAHIGAIQVNKDPKGKYGFTALESLPT